MTLKYIVTHYLALFGLQKAGNVMQRLNSKRSQIDEITKALATADVNGDCMIDFDELRHDLKMSVQSYFIIYFQYNIYFNII